VVPQVAFTQKGVRPSALALVMASSKQIVEYSRINK
jgi:hypothetical protein